MAFPVVQHNCWCLRTQRNDNWETLCFSQTSNSQRISGKNYTTEMTFQLTSTIKAFLSDSLSICLMATSFALHLALHTTPKAPLPTTWVKSKQRKKKTPRESETNRSRPPLMLKQTWKVKEDFRNHHDLDLPQSQYEFSLKQGDNKRHCLYLWKFMV